MSDAGDILWVIPALPLAASVLTALAGPKLLRGQSHWLTVLGSAGAFAVSLAVFIAVFGGGGHANLIRYAGFNWFEAGGVTVTVSLTADPIAAVMLIAVTFIGTWIAVFSAGYMHGDPGYARYFAVMSLFLFSMTGLVLADNFLVLYACWEGVGLCSYLLVGFWYTKPSAAQAARKAFLVTRIGDAGLAVGIFLLWLGCGFSLDYATVFERAPTLAAEQPALFTAACLLIFCGAVGKSAQFPLHVWLPDAMEGPTPVSALIHAATMVTAGVYLVARCTPLFEHAPAAQATVAVIGAFTALLAALIALTQNDLKRVLAYSTVSQLGYMFLALGSIGYGLATVAVTAAIFHLFTHAFFKALLFLAAGSVMHGTGGVIDMRRFGGLKTVMPVTRWTFLVGALALAGVPPLAGFFSKDQILESALHRSEVVLRNEARGGTTTTVAYLGDDRLTDVAPTQGVVSVPLNEDVHAPYALLYQVLFGVAVLAAGLTAFYTFRAYFLTFHGPTVLPEEAGEHAHESPPIMTLPLVVLAVGALGVGAVLAPFTHGFAKDLVNTLDLNQERMRLVRAEEAGALGGAAATRTPLHAVAARPDAEVGAAGAKFAEKVERPGRAVPAHHETNWVLVLGTSAVALAGVGLAALFYLRPRKAEVPGRAGLLTGLSQNRFYLDDIYEALIVKPMEALAYLARGVDTLIDGVAEAFAKVPGWFGGLFRPVQNGLVQFYALTMVVMLVCLTLYAVSRP